MSKTKLDVILASKYADIKEEHIMKNIEARRNFLKYMSILGMAAFCSTPLYAKTTKAIMKYQLMPNNGNKCSMCMHFIPETNECHIVEGPISPDGWCTSFFKNPKP